MDVEVPNSDTDDDQHCQNDADNKTCADDQHRLLLFTYYLLWMHHWVLLKSSLVHGSVKFNCAQNVLEADSSTVVCAPSVELEPDKPVVDPTVAAVLVLDVPPVVTVVFETEPVVPVVPTVGGVTITVCTSIREVLHQNSRGIILCVQLGPVYP